MPISLTIDNSLSETVTLFEFSTPGKTPSNQSNHEKTDDISRFIFKYSKIQHSTPICSKHSTPTENKFASHDSIELSLQSMMNNFSILNSKTDEKETFDNIMYLIPKEPQVDQKEGSSYSKSSKLLTKVLGDSEEILRYDGMRKKNQMWQRFFLHIYRI